MSFSSTPINFSYEDDGYFRPTNVEYNPDLDVEDIKFTDDGYFRPANIKSIGDIKPINILEEDDDDEEDDTPPPLVEKRGRVSRDIVNNFYRHINNMRSLGIKIPSQFAILGNTDSGKSNTVRVLQSELDSIINIAAVWHFGVNFGKEQLHPGHGYAHISKTKINAIRELGLQLKAEGWYQIVIFDDVDEDDKMHNVPFIKNLLKTAKHINTICLFGLHHLKQVTTLCRKQFSYWFVCNADNETVSELHRLAKTRNKQEFMDNFSDEVLAIGKPMVLCTIPQKQELVQIDIPLTPPDKLGLIGY